MGQPATAQPLVVAPGRPVWPRDHGSGRRDVGGRLVALAVRLGFIFVAIVIETDRGRNTRRRFFIGGARKLSRGPWRGLGIVIGDNGGGRNGIGDGGKGQE